MSAAPASATNERGIQFWMERAVKEIGAVATDFAPDPVHDLRVALRRCRAIAEGMRTIDPDPRWKKMRRAAKALFSSLGELRDVQVLEEWTRRLGAEDDSAKPGLLAYFQQREAELKVCAAAALANFNQDDWLRWASILDARARKHPVDVEVFEVVALEKLDAAEALQRTAARTRSKTALHSVRIGLKRLRYVVENFLPEHHERWRDDLKLLQDVLGEIHDLDVLWATALRIRSFSSAEERQSWRNAIAQARGERVSVYKERLGGRHSLLHRWRRELPDGDALRRAIRRKFEIWAGFLDPDPAHSKRVLRTSLELYDRLLELDFAQDAKLGDVSGRDLLTIAVLVHEIGRAGGSKGHRKRTTKKLGKLDVPPGWTHEHLRMIDLIAQCHRGALTFGDSTFRRLARAKQRTIMLLGGIIRLAETLDAGRSSENQPPILEQQAGFLVLRVDGYEKPEEVAAACYLLETACKIPVLVTSTDDGSPTGPGRKTLLTRRPVVPTIRQP